MFMTGFCDTAWAAIAPLRAAVLALPFNTELAEGTLSLPRFRFYLVQDSRYLLGFGRALAVAAARAPDPDDLVFLAGAARDAVLVERELHAGYFARFGLDEAAQQAVPTSPTTLAYSSFLLATAQTGDYPELLAALLPCFWIYQEVAAAVAARPISADHPFRAWIDTYADESFAAATGRCRQAVDAAAQWGDQGRMLAAFTRAAEYEWLFWDSAHRLETWPTAGLVN
jgi:thiaminase/transcriptional activator TenA